MTETILDSTLTPRSKAKKDEMLLRQIEEQKRRQLKEYELYMRRQMDPDLTSFAK
jgi:hypothetical protein